MAERSVHDQIQDILNKLARAHKRGTGCRLTAHEMHILSVTMIGQWWGQPDERAAPPRGGSTRRQWNGRTERRSVMPIIANLVCWHCGAQKEVTLPHPPQFAFELAGWANDVGMYGVMDMRYGRALVFCNEDHANNEKTKAGHYRVRAKGPAKQQEPTNG